MDKPTDIHQILTEISNVCPPVILSIKVVQSEILRSDFKFGNLRNKLDIFDLNEFISDCLRDIIVFGYCIYRFNPKKILFENLPAQYVELNLEKSRFKMKLREDAPPRFKQSNWQLRIVKKPVLNLDGTFKHSGGLLTSALSAIQRYVLLDNNMLSRDTQNTRHLIYTRYSQDIAAASKKNNGVYFDRLHATMTQTDILGSIDYEEYIKTRHDIADKFSQNNLALDPYSNKKKAVHTESPITDGRDYNEARHLQQDGDIIRVSLQNAYFMVMQTLGVPPQTIGHNINSERLAASGMLTEVVLEQFTSSIETYRNLVNDILLSATSPFGKIGPVQIAHCLTPHQFQRLQNYFTVDGMVKFLACVYKCEEKYINRELIEAQQKQLIEPRQKRPADIEQKSEAERAYRAKFRMGEDKEKIDNKKE